MIGTAFKLKKISKQLGRDTKKRRTYDCEQNIVQEKRHVDGEHEQSALLHVAALILHSSARLVPISGAGAGAQLLRTLI